MPNVLITGSARGLGKALAGFFNKHDYGLFLVARSEKSAGELNNEFPSAKILLADVSSPEYENSLKDWLGGSTMDVVINNAGIGGKGPTLDTATADQIRSVFETNCIGTFTTVKGALKALKRSKEAIVINISSRRGSLSMQAAGAAKNSDCSYAYRISKAAQNMLTLCMADDFENEGIKIAAIHPGRLLTSMASEDACMTPEISAEKIGSLIIGKKINHGDFLCMETGPLQW